MDKNKKETIKAVLKLVGCIVTMTTLELIAWDKVFAPWISGSEEM